jgi:hypothetical protein
MQSIVRSRCSTEPAPEERTSSWSPDQQRITEPVHGPREARTRFAAQHPGELMSLATAVESIVRRIDGADDVIYGASDRIR